VKNLIYQYWDGDYKRSGVVAGVQAMKKYAETIGAEYIFEANPEYAKSLGFNFGQYTPHYGAFKPILQGWDYDKILFADTDVFPVHDLQTNIFEEIVAGIGICREQWQTLNKPLQLRETDKAWARVVESHYGINVPRDINGNVIIYNSGVVLYTKHGMELAQKHFVPFNEYVNLVAGKFPSFYSCDQPYLHAMMLRQGMEWTELNQDWNRYVHYLPETRDPRPVNDTRSNTTKFVHIQLRGADDWAAEKLWRVTNLPVSEW
jgi:hypothetical protein